ncbi:hypothetical protein [Asticcacaulis sp. AC402]|uniref:hypothetical protein n=1 Tax=Asticcacaulis sp. AC402 TaxID=1282361 RepID=UPI001F19E918|nr:hypothetical protein [Asticcacaulis sp. AC402]
MKPLACLIAALALAPWTSHAQNSLGAPPPLSVYGNLPDTDQVALAPAGDKVALVTNRDGKRMIFDHNMITGESHASLIQYGKLRDLFWVDDDHILATISKSGTAFSWAFESYTTLMVSVPKQSIREIGYGEFHIVELGGKLALYAGGYDTLYQVPGPVATTASWNRHGKRTPTSTRGPCATTARRSPAPSISPRPRCGNYSSRTTSAGPPSTGRPRRSPRPA